MQSLGERILASDPGLVRLEFAFCAMASLAAAGAAAWFFSLAVGAPKVGILLALIAAQLPILMLRGSNHDLLRRSALAMMPGLWLGVAVYQLIGHSGVAAMVATPLLLSAAFIAGLAGLAAHSAVLATAWIYLFSMYFKVPAADWMWQVAYATLGVAIASVVRFALWRNSGASTTNRIVRSFRLNLSQFLSDVSEAKSEGARWTAIHRFRQRVASVSDVLASRPAEWGGALDGVDDASLAAEQIARTDASGDLSKRIRQLSDALRLGQSVQPQGPAERLLLEGLDSIERGVSATARATEHAAPSPSGKPTPTAYRGDLLRRSVQVLVAVSLAVLFGSLISEDRWAWAVLTAVMLFVGTESSGDILSKGAQGIVGAVVGVALGFVLTDLLSPHPAVEIAALGLLMFGAIYLMPASYPVGTACITASLAIAYDLGNQPVSILLGVRLAEVVAGGLIGIGVGQLILPRRTRDTFLAKLADLLDALLEAIRSPDEVGHTRKPRQALNALFKVGRPVETIGFGELRPGVTGVLAQASRMVHLLELLKRSSHADNKSADLADELGRLTELLQHLRYRVEDLEPRTVPARSFPPYDGEDQTMRIVSALQDATTALASSVDRV